MTRGLAVMLAVGLWATVPVILAVGCGDDSGTKDAGADEHGEHGEHEDHDAENVGPDSGATCPDGGTDLTYDNFGKAFFSQYCVRCHSTKVKGAARMMAPADHNFDTLDEIELLSKHIDQMAAAGTVTNEMMPPSAPKPSVADRKKLGEWIACKVPE